MSQKCEIHSFDPKTPKIDILAETASQSSPLRAHRPCGVERIRIFHRFWPSRTSKSGPPKRLPVRIAHGVPKHPSSLPLDAHTDRQTDGRTGNQTDRQADRQTSVRADIPNDLKSVTQHVHKPAEYPERCLKRKPCTHSESETCVGLGLGLGLGLVLGVRLGLV